MKRRTNYTTDQPDTIVCLEWVDASSQEGPLTIDELTGVYKLVTVGLLVRENEDHVSVAMDYVPENKQFRCVQHVLKRNVTSRKEFKA